MSFARISKHVAQAAIDLVYPPQCPGCKCMVAGPEGLCGPCRGQMPFIHGASCALCGAPFIGDAKEGDSCDECRIVARPWAGARATLLYSGLARNLVLGCKHGDRTELAPIFAGWMAQTIAGLDVQSPLIVPVPIHWTRLVYRRYNQAALLANELATQIGCEALPTALIRTKRTPILDGKDRETRFATLASAIQPGTDAVPRLKNRDILLVDDVMTTGATLAAATDALYSAGAQKVYVLVLARVTKDT